MMQTVTINSINNKAIRLLEDLELLQLIRVHKEKIEPAAATDWATNTKEQWLNNL